MLYQYDDDDFCKAWGIENDLDWLVICYFNKQIDIDKDEIIAIFVPVY